jgi:hypothetical protein
VKGYGVTRAITVDLTDEDGTYTNVADALNVHVGLPIATEKKTTNLGSRRR